MQIAQALQTGLQLHQLGRLNEAQSVYRQVLSADPANFDALHLLGVATHQLGRHAEAATLISQAIERNAGEPLAHNNLGDVYRSLGQWDLALASFEKALALQPDFDEVHNNIGETYRVMGRLNDAQAVFEKVLTHKPQYAEAHNNLGLVLHALGQLNQAVACFEQAVALKRDYAKAYLNLGSALQSAGDLDRALQCFDKALSIKPAYPEALLALAGLFNQKGELKKALLCCQRLLQTEPKQASHWQLYADIIKLLHTEALDCVDTAMLVQALRHEAVDPQKLERIATALVCSATPAQQLLASIDANEPERQSAVPLAEETLSVFIGMPLLLAVLEEAQITDYRLETLLTLIRQTLLNWASNDDPRLQQPAVEHFACSLALQCFANEYLFATSAPEELALPALGAKIVAAIDRHATCPAAWVAVAGCYQALHARDFADKLLLSRWSQPHLQALVLRQLTQPQQEARLKQDIPGLTGIDNDVSQAVRQQYEENPYPRWRRRGGQNAAQALHLALKRRLPHQTSLPDASPSPLQVLVAGCGTGSDASQVAQSFADAEILAVDISKTSLAYAKRATAQFGLTNIDFRHGDILELGVLDRQFDLIVCSGVLHHMGKPLDGWRVLTNLLSPDGYMNIGLYSRRARRDIIALREWVAEHDYPTTTDGIRRFRNDVMRGSSGIDLGNIAISPDFYSISACRDLIFHVQEHQFSPLDIQAHLDELGLQFLGFEFSNPEIRKRYLARFPDNPACDSLANWEIVEADNPDIFAGMYQFWVKKRT